MEAFKMRMPPLSFLDQLWANLMRRERALPRSKGENRDISRPVKSNMRKGTANKQQVAMTFM